MKEVYGIIYKIENLVNGKIYIGQTTRSFNERYNAKGKGIERVYGYLLGCERYGDSHNVYLLKSIRKYGFINFEVEEVFDIAYDRKELDEKEKYWIKYYNACDPNYGYNSLPGGTEGGINKECYLKKVENEFTCPVMCLETGEMFMSKSEAMNKLNISNIKMVHISKENKYNAYKIKKEYEAKDRYTFIKLNNDNCRLKPILCVTNKKIYVTYLAVNKDLFKSCHTKEILACCNGEMDYILRKSSKKSIRKIPYEFMYAIDYLIDSKFK